MEDGDLGTWEKPRIMLVLEDTLAHVTGRMAHSGFLFRKGWVADEPDVWEWGTTTVKTIQRYAYNSVPVEVVTFLTPEVADFAAIWFDKYGIDVAGTGHYELEHFQRALTWRRNGIQRIIDTDPERLLHYGQLGYQTTWNSEF
jgi:hypothetical protein